MIGKTIIITMYIGAFFKPAKTRNKKTSAAVGIALKATIVGLNTYFNLIKLPTIIPNTIAANAPIRNPYIILFKDPKIHL